MWIACWVIVYRTDAQELFTGLVDACFQWFDRVVLKDD